MSEMPQSIFSSRTGGPLANYPHAKRVGNLLFLSGLSARQPDGTVRGANILSDGSGQCSITEQAEGILENMRGILAEVHAGFENVVDLTVYLVDMTHYAEFNQVYNKYFTQKSGPARTCVAVSALPGRHLLVEVKAIAYIP